MGQVERDRAERFLKFLYANRARFVHDLTYIIYERALQIILSAMRINFPNKFANTARNNLSRIRMDTVAGTRDEPQPYAWLKSLSPDSLKKLADFYTNNEMNFKTAVSNSTDGKNDQ